MLIDIFQKVIEELYSSKQPFHISWEGSEERLEKMFDNYSHISDEDYLKLTSKSGFTQRTLWSISEKDSNMSTLHPNTPLPRI